jgi:hypothetical protein
MKAGFVSGVCSVTPDFGYMATYNFRVLALPPRKYLGRRKFCAYWRLFLNTLEGDTAFEDNLDKRKDERGANECLEP